MPPRPRCRSARRPRRPARRRIPSSTGRKCVRASPCPIRAGPSTCPSNNEESRMKLRRAVLFVSVFAFALPALAYIEAMKELKGLFMESEVIARGVVDAVSTEKKVVILKMSKNIKGKCVYERIKIDL